MSLCRSRRKRKTTQSFSSCQSFQNRRLKKNVGVLLVFIFVLGCLSGLAPIDASALALSFCMFASFRYGRLGLKNDILAALWMSGLLVASWVSLKRYPSPRAFFVTLAVGILGAG